MTLSTQVAIAGQRTVTIFVARYKTIGKNPRKENAITEIKLFLFLLIEHATSTVRTIVDTIWMIGIA